MKSPTLSGQCFARPSCVGLFRSSHLTDPPAAYPFVEILSRNELDANLIRFQLTPTRKGGFVLSVFYNGAKAGQIDAHYFLDKGQLIGHFEAHSRLEDRYRRKGLGALIYVVAAKVLFRNTGQVLMSTTSPSTDAEAVWARFEKANWTTAYEPGEFSRRGFRPEILELQFNHALTFFDTRHIEIDPNDI